MATSATGDKLGGIERLSAPPAEPVVDELRKTWKPPSGLAALSTVQNGPIAKRYFVVTLTLFLVAGLGAMVMRTQLIRPENDLISPEIYNQIFTMHGTTMMYLVMVPAIGGFATLLMPQILGTRDMPFPRMTQLGFWALLFGTLILYSSVFFGAVPNGGWFVYTPLAEKQYSPGLNLDFWLLGLGFIEVASMGSATEFVVATLKTRAFGMSLNRIPIFAWTVLVLGFSILFGFTPLLVGTTFLELDRKIGTRFFDPTGGGNPLLWSHLFWIFGHPEVYIQFIPATGMVSMIVPAMARRRLAGHTLIVAVIIATGFLSFGLWVHHMFTTGLSQVSLNFFSAASMTIAIPSGVQIFAWIMTLWGAKVQWKTPLLFVLGFIIIFILGGISGVMVGAVPFNWQVHDTYFVVAHFHYVLFGGVVFPLFAAIYYWFPKISGKMLSERLGKWHFWLTFIGFNVAFLPMHLAGFWGMGRRWYTYPAGLGLEIPNLISTLGAYVIGLGVLVMVANIIWSFRSGEKASPNPWDAGTLEWATPMPLVPPPFFTVPIVRSRDPLWDQERIDQGDEQTAAIARGLAQYPTKWRATAATSILTAQPEAIIRLAGPSWWPLALGVALALIFLGGIFDLYWMASIGLLGTIAAAIGWLWPSKDDLATTLSDEQPMLYGLPLTTSGTTATGWWGLVLTLVIVGVAIMTSIFSYYYLSISVPVWPPANVPMPQLLLPGISTALLVVSSAPLIWAEWSIRRGRQAGLKIGLLLGFALGVGFVVVELISLLQAGFTPQTNAYGSIFFSMVGFMLLIAAIGLLMNAVIQVQSWLGHFNRWRFLGVQNTALFWHFTVVAWLVTFAVVYLSPYFA